LARALSIGGKNMNENRQVMQTTHLARNPNDKWVAGVCGGIARWLGWDSGMVRLLYILLSVCSAAFPGTIVYIILWMLMPSEE
jgi:phage shock protein C